jgi:hypothetical protein
MGLALITEGYIELKIWNNILDIIVMNRLLLFHPLYLQQVITRKPIPENLQIRSLRNAEL